MKKRLPLITITATILFTSCAGKLTEKEATVILEKEYTGGNDPDNNGNSFTIINSITVDSIHQQDSNATVFYHVSGRVENGSKYPKEISADAQETEFTKGLFGWKLK